MRPSSTARRRYPPSSAAMRRQENEPFVVNREVRAVIVPAGQEVRLKPGQAGYITQALGGSLDRKSTRLNSSHLVISYAVFCLKKKTIVECRVIVIVQSGHDIKWRTGREIYDA